MASSRGRPTIVVVSFPCFFFQLRHCLAAKLITQKEVRSAQYLRACHVKRPHATETLRYFVQQRHEEDYINMLHVFTPWSFCY